MVDGQCQLEVAKTLERRLAAIEGYSRPRGTDLAEYPPAFFKEGGIGASVRAIPSHENRTAGACIMWQLRALPDGAQVLFEVVP